MLAKYGDNVLNDSGMKSSSNVWKILKEGGKFLKPIVRWKVGNGERIFVLNDIWLLNRCLNEWPTFLNCTGLENMYLHQLFTDSGDWDVAKLAMYFNEDLICIIREVKMDVLQADLLETIFKFFGKSISGLAYEEVLRRKEIFWWRLYKFAIPSNHFLKFRRLAEEDCCARGCLSVENYEHIVVHCKFLQEILECIRKWRFGLPVFQSLEECMLQLRGCSRLNSGLARIYCVAVFLNWKNRNLVKHGKNALPCSITAANVISLAVLKSCPTLVS
ncbi:hypothetical protein KFK09_014846 [Dendrobium nobile]|uniref:Reverse transcriptase zinc-binding domain-containing protein n=1 Tax=Dendrobium nobile TaxID=94219 RepID=A0A8T3B481_DENNO|nr:hypothetical protein KFK09_014846 [Dendrobium nobile]